MFSFISLNMQKVVVILTKLLYSKNIFRSDSFDSLTDKNIIARLIDLSFLSA